MDQDNHSVTVRQLRAVEMREAGKSYDAIAKALGYRSASGAFAAVDAALKKSMREPSAKVRRIVLRRLDRLLESLWPTALTGDVEAIDRVLKIETRRAALQGLDAPKRNEITGRNGEALQIELEVVETVVRTREEASSVLDLISREDAVKSNGKVE